MKKAEKRKYKFVLQKKNYDCGVGASATLLKNAKVVDVDYTKLGRMLRLNPRIGVLSKNISSYFSNFVDLKPKLKTRSKIDDLRRETRKGRFALVMYQTWGKPHEIKNLVCGHYGVVVKVYRNKVYLLDPGAEKDKGHGVGWRIIEAREFKKLWIDKEYGKITRGWMLSVRPLKRKKTLKFVHSFPFRTAQ